MACCGHRSVTTPGCGRAQSLPREVDSPLHRCRESSLHAMARSTLTPDGRPGSIFRPRCLAPFLIAARLGHCSVTPRHSLLSPLIAVALVLHCSSQRWSFVAVHCSDVRSSRWWSLVVELPPRSVWAYSPLATAGNGRFLQRRGARPKLTPSGRSGAGAVCTALSHAATGVPSRHQPVRARRPSL